MKLEEFNTASPEEAAQIMMKCCHCRSWAESVASNRPYESTSTISHVATQLWLSTSEQEKLDAFAAHPRIGDIKVLRDKMAAQAHKEQGQVKEASEETLAALVKYNDLYFEKHGFIFIICAKGKAPEFMLDALKHRLENSRALEIDNAAEEQGKILQLRIQQNIEE